jgi:hypothetical protein
MPVIWDDLTLPPLNLYNMPNNHADVSLSPLAYSMLQGWLKGSLGAFEDGKVSDWGTGYQAALLNLKSLLSDLEEVK